MINKIKVECEGCKKEKVIELESNYVPDFIKELDGWLHHDTNFLVCPNPECKKSHLDFYPDNYPGKHSYSPISELALQINCGISMDDFEFSKKFQDWSDDQMEMVNKLTDMDKVKIKCSRCQKEIEDGVFLQSLSDDNEVLETICFDCVPDNKPDDDINKDNGEFGMGGDWWKAAGESDDGH